MMTFDDFIVANWPRDSWHIDCPHVNDRGADCIEINRQPLCPACQIYADLCAKWERMIRP